MLLDEIQDRLKAGLADLTVHGAAEFAAARDELQRDTLYVIPVRETAGENTLGNRVRQRRTLTVGVVLGAVNRRDRRGEAASRELHALNNQVIDTLLGWTPPSAESPLEYRDGRILAVRRGTTWWQSHFETTDFLSAV